MGKNFLLEIGTEEMPAHFIDPAIRQMYDFSLEYFKNKKISLESVKIWATPRRLVVYIENLGEKQEAQEEEIRGPAAHIGYKDGMWTEVAKRFVEQYGASLEDLHIEETPKGKYIFLRKVKEGMNTLEILPDYITSLLKSIRFPKMMKWGDVDFYFGRPIRWIVALYGDTEIEVEIAGVKSSRYSRPPRFLPQIPIEIRDADSYLNVMRENYIIVDQEERKNEILKQINKIANENSFILDYEDDLLKEVNYLVEYPTALLGEFDKKYLALPEVVLIITMEKKQRYFPLRDADGNLTNKFIVIRNGTDNYKDIVIQGNEKVLKARLSDAEYYYHEDTKHPLEKYTEKLSGIIFQEQLGTIKDKVERVRILVREIANILGLSSEENKILERSVNLYKADLGTLMVSEYPELHGIMGRIYAKISGEKDPIPEVIGEYIYPRTLDDRLPSNFLASILGIADRIDSLTGYFALDLFPTGSEDPIGLRRISGGLLRLLLESSLKLNLRNLFVKSFEIYNFGEKYPLSQIDKGMGFIGQRLRNLLLDRYSIDIVDAVMEVGYDEMWRLKRRLDFISKFKEKESYEKLKKALNRLYRILPKDFTPKEVSENLLSSPFEKKLYEDYLKIKNEIFNDILEGNYEVLLSYDFLNEFSDDIEKFFDNVLVMSPNEDERINRLSLLSLIKLLFWEILDWSRLS
ncbi:glycine--tRNA ligase subunit beta [Dictyoglomus thermophilum]|uniref:Glycine--tRNA ligase beta subunit n=1 Tax=Dictyoglomus thermophilum (strain ATCC 35947 / DSM 3960 / H-6-12) TaxID=309799 RepID=SYGB_DICT6|nr:glycine--tRNA ligase subunit beta [Dictyoglomus thermophilum]B5YES4.1 RecName: Full=Glycine--tRNA ligase beta subunit; AltName: Full=Glycyl-tRNA synthetase beta subunit; Short=GlyRS [Dictyoglomus thermophilum H-6-12]ACI19384.1 glycyl-tRNA synthetase, beta subunit [Dictyoglomus thermophilum H-6-12]